MLVSNDRKTWKTLVTPYDSVYEAVSVLWTGKRLVIGYMDARLSEDDHDETPYANSLISLFPFGTKTTKSSKGIFGWGSASESAPDLRPHYLSMGGVISIPGLASKGDSAIVAVTGDGQIFTCREVSSWIKQAPVEGSRLNDVAWTGSYWVAVGNGGLILTSPDAVKWTRFSSGPLLNLKAAAWTGSQYVVLGDSGFLLSPDATNWTFVRSDSAQFLKHVTWTGKTLIAVGAEGLIQTSFDGRNWVTRKTLNIENLNFVRWTGSQVVAVGDNGTILTSPDGILWTPRTSGVTNELTTVVWTGQQLVVVGTGAPVILTSKDGITWTTRFEHYAGHNGGIVWTGSYLLTAGWPTVTSLNGNQWIVHETAVSDTTLRTDRTMDRIVWTGNGFVGLENGEGGKLFTSRDGLNWIRVFKQSSYLNAILWNGKRLLVVGENGTILTSP